MITEEEMARHIREFEAVCGFRQGVGALDECHFPISPPKTNATDYYNYKGCLLPLVLLKAAVKETVASSKRLARVAMACMSAEMSLVATGEGLRLASGDGTDVASVVVPEVKSMGACTASLGGEAA
ncbi:hypothetical protein MTO96_033128 [Rhipicephalus appendiculatus]